MQPYIASEPSYNRYRYHTTTDTGTIQPYNQSTILYRALYNHTTIMTKRLEVGVLGGEHGDEEQADGVAAHAKCLRVRQTCETRK
jgi:hypothetical protein